MTVDAPDTRHDKSIGEGREIILGHDHDYGVETLISEAIHV